MYDSHLYRQYLFSQAATTSGSVAVHSPQQLVLSNGNQSDAVFYDSTPDQFVD